MIFGEVKALSRGKLRLKNKNIVIIPVPIKTVIERIIKIIIIIRIIKILRGIIIK